MFGSINSLGAMSASTGLAKWMVNSVLAGLANWSTVWVVMLMSVGIRMRHLFLLLTVGIVGAYFAWIFALAPYQKDRILAFINPYSDPTGYGYHIIQSEVAIGSGGLWGRGLGQGTALLLSTITAIFDFDPNTLRTGAANLAGNGDALGNSFTQLSKAAHALSDSRTDIFDTVKNLQTFVQTLADNDAHALWMARRSAGLLSGFGPPAFAAMTMSLVMRVKALAIRFHRANMVALRVSKMRPMARRIPQAPSGRKRGPRGAGCPAGPQAQSRGARSTWRRRASGLPAKIMNFGTASLKWSGFGS